MKWALLVATLAAGCQSTIEPDLSTLAYPCVYDAGDTECPSGARCGANDRCHPDSPGPWGCAIESDCEGWHCGPEHVCYPLDAGDPTDGGYACASSADCVEGSRCGLNGHCHTIGAAEAYACATDSDCEGGWRCNPDGTCVDPTGDGLPQALYSGALIATRVSPTMGGLPDLFALEAFDGLSSNQCPNSLVTRHVAFIKNGQLTQATVCDDGSAPEVLTSSVSSTVFPDATRMVVARGVIFVAVDGGVEAVDPSMPESLPTFLPLSAGFLPKRLTVAGYQTASNQLSNGAVVDTDPLVIASDDSTLYVLHTSQLDAGFAFAGPTPGAGPIFDLASVDAPGSGLGSALIVATDAGLFIAPRVTDGGLSMFVDDAGAVDPSTPFWQPISLDGVDNDGCPSPTPGTLRVTLITSVNTPGDQTMLVLELTDGGSSMTAQLNAYLDLSNVVVAGGNCPGATWLSPSAVQYGLGASWAPTTVFCPACPGGIAATYLDNDVVTSMTDTIVECQGGVAPQRFSLTDCGAPTTADEWDFWLAQLSFEGPKGIHDSTFAVAGDDALLVSEASVFNGQEAYYGSFPRLGPVTLAAVPDDAFGTREAIVAVLGGGAFGPFPFRVAPGLGLVQGSNSATPPRGSVRGRPTWQIEWQQQGVMLGIGPSDSDAGLAAGFGFGLNDSIPTPVTAVVGTLPDGGALAMLGMHDSLYATELDDQAPDRFRLRAVPLSNANISSLALLTPTVQADGGFLYAEGYGVSDAEAFRFSAQSPFEWTTEQLLISSSEPLKVWSDGARGRIGFQDGTIYALPTRTQIAPPLLSGVQDFEQLCGQPLALTVDALYRLVPADGGIGTWVESPLGPLTTADGLLSSGGAFDGGRLFPIENGVVVFSQLGTAQLITTEDGGCP